MRKALLLSLGFLVVLGTMVAPAVADGEDFGLERFEMPMSRESILNVEGAQVPLSGTWGVNLFLGYADDPLVVNASVDGGDWERQGSPVGHQLSGSLGAFLVLQKNLALGARLPLTLHQGTDRDALSGLANLASTGQGDLTFMAKYQFLDHEDGDPVHLALGFNYTLPSSFKEFMGNNYLTFSPYVAVARGVGPMTAIVNAGVKLQEVKHVGDLRVSNELFSRLGLSYGWGVNELGTTLSYSGALSNLTTDNPIGFGRFGARVANTPCGSESKNGTTVRLDPRTWWRWLSKMMWEKPSRSFRPSAYSGKISTAPSLLNSHVG